MLGGRDDIRGSNGNATATADASAAGGGKAIATAVATVPSDRGPGLEQTFANATSDAVTVNGAMAQALSTAVSSEFETQATSTAKTSFAGVSVQSTAAFVGGFSGTAMTDAIAQGGTGTFATAGDAFAVATAMPDKSYATALIGGASDVADALLGPDDKIFGTAILGRNGGIGDSSTFDFSFRGDLILGEVDDDRVDNLGFISGPIDLTIEGPGIFVLGGVVPEPSTWAMMLIGFAGLGFAGYRRARAGHATLAA